MKIYLMVTWLILSVSGHEVGQGLVEGGVTAEVGAGVVTRGEGELSWTRVITLVYRQSEIEEVYICVHYD